MLCEAQPALIVIFKKILENGDLAGGSVPFSIRKWGAAPLKKRLGYRETALMGLS